MKILKSLITKCRSQYEPASGFTLLSSNVIHKGKMMTQEEIQMLAQQLVDAKLEIKRLEEEQNIAKLELYDNARGGIQCNGGKVYFVEEREERRFNQERLRQSLQALNLSEEQINTIFNSSKVQTTRDANIHIILDR